MAGTPRPTWRWSRGDGALLAFVRGSDGSPHHLGVAGCVELRRGACSTRPVRKAGLARDGRDRSLGSATFMLAGVDFPAEEEELLRRDATALGWADGSRSGMTPSRCCVPARHRGWGVAVDVRQRHQLRGRRAGTDDRSGSRHWARSPAIGAAARTSGSRRSVRPRGARTDAVPNRRSRRRPGTLRGGDTHRTGRGHPQGDDLRARAVRACSCRLLIRRPPDAGRCRPLGPPHRGEIVAFIARCARAPGPGRRVPPRCSWAGASSRAATGTSCEANTAQVCRDLGPDITVRALPTRRPSWAPCCLPLMRWGPARTQEARESGRRWPPHRGGHAARSGRHGPRRTRGRRSTDG